MVAGSVALAEVFFIFENIPFGAGESPLESTQGVLPIDGCLMALRLQPFKLKNIRHFAESSLISQLSVITESWRSYELGPFDPAFRVAL